MSYKYLGSVLKIVNEFIEENIKEDNIVVDCTVGNGNDTVKLLKKIGLSGKLYGFDIQKEAIDNTLDKIREESLTKKNFRLINDGHENIDRYVEQNIDFAIYNLGYLPGYDKKVATEYHTTIQSIDKSLKLLNGNGVVMIVVYHGHKAGLLEKEKLESYLNNLDQKYVNVLKIEYTNQINNPPFLYIIEKNN